MTHFKKALSLFLALCLTLELLPAGVLAVGSESFETRTLTSGSVQVKTDESGRVAAVKCDDATRAEALQLLFADSDTTAPQKSAGLLSSGLSEAEYLAASALHGDAAALNRELAELRTEQERDGLSAQQIADIRTLICSGYSYRQARAALVASTILGCTIETLCAAKAAELTGGADEEPPADDVAAAAVKMGIPASLLEASTQTLAATQAAFQNTMNAAYSSVSSAQSTGEEEPSLSYAPQILPSAPFNYQKNGSINVNISDGSYIFSETDLSLPGVNGLDLNIVRQFDPKWAKTLEPLGVTTGLYETAETLKVSFDAYVSYDEENADAFELVADFSQYTLYDSASMESLQRVCLYRADQYDQALGSLNTRNAAYAGVLWAATDPDGDACVMKFNATIKGIGHFDEAFENAGSPNTFLVDLYGLGHGWRLGFSTIEPYLTGTVTDGVYDASYRLTLADGRVYNIDENGCIESDLTDMTLSEGGSYPGAAHTLTYQDGKKEYFDTDGRNIAIEDRFGNRITLTYTTAEDGNERITIVDTLGNTVLYQEQTVALDGASFLFVPGTTNQRYNRLYTLSLNGRTIRTYYARQSTSSSGARFLIAVADELGQLTTLSNSTRQEAYNAFAALPSPNDEPYCRVSLKSVTYPGSQRLAFTYNGTKRELLGSSGYSRAYTVATVAHEDAGDSTSSQSTSAYSTGDFSGYYYGRDELMQYQCEAKAYHRALGDSMGGYRWNSYRVEYDFNCGHELQRETRYDYPSVPELTFTHDDLYATTDALGISRIVDYTYTSSGLPASIFTREYEPGVSSAFTASTRSYTYDSAGNILSETTPNGERTTYTYGNYAIPLTKTWRQDANTTIVQTNTLTADQKAIAETTVSANGAVQSKAAYTYDARGRVTEIAQYLSTSEHITQQFAYDNSAAATQVTTLQVKTADGANAVSTPGGAAGSITEKTTYNDRGLPTSYTDGSGNTTAYAYDAAGNVTSITYPDGLREQYAYDFANRTIEHTDPVGTKTVYQYNVFGQLAEVSDKESEQVLESFLYDSLGRLTRHTEQRYGSTTTTEYDERDRLLSETVTDSTGAVLSQTLYSYRILSAAPAASAVQPNYLYTGGSNNAVSVVTKTVVGDEAAPSVVTTQYTDINGNVVRTGKLLGGTEYLDTYTYDFCGNLLTHLTAQDAASGLAYSEKYLYNAAGQAVKSYNALGQYTTAAYDWLGRTTSSTDYAGTPTTCAYDALGRLLRQTLTVQDGITAVTKYDYDAAGNIIREWTPTNAVGEAAAWAKTEYSYDSRNRLVRVRQYNGGSVAMETAYTYDGAGQLLSTTTGGSTTAYTYDRFGSVLTTTDALAQSETNVYSPTGRLLRSTDRAGKTTVYTFDALGRVLSTVANGEEVCYTYTKTGQLRTEENAASRSVYTYDALGRLTQAVQTDKAPTPSAEPDPVPQPDPTPEPDPAVTCTVTLDLNYDGTLTLVPVAYGSCFTLPTPTRDDYLFSHWTSDGAIYLADTALTITQDVTFTAQWLSSGSAAPTPPGGLSPVEPSEPAEPVIPGDPIPLDPVIPPVDSLLLEDEDGCVSTRTYVYDLTGNRTRFTLVLGETTVQDVAYTYDALSRLRTVSEDGALQATYTYDANGNRARLTYANGVVTTYTYNAANWVTSLQNTKNGATLSGFTYAYYASGSQKSKTDHNGAVTTYVYDDLNRLVQEAESGAQTVSYAYDARGNRTQRTVTGSANYTVSYTYDALNRLTQEQKTVASLTDTTTYAYDANGNLKSQLTVGASGTSAAVYSYDAYNRLISSTSGEQRTTYTYDPQGLRLSKQTGEARTVFLLDGGSVAAEVVNGQLTATYLRGANLIARNEEYYLFNAHGDVVNLTNASGAVTRSYVYDAFGNEKNPSENDANPFRYCGEYFDSETGTYYLRARYYDPAIGRFTQADTHWNVANMIYGDNPQKISEREDALGLKAYTYAPQITAVMQSGNLYVYCIGNPIYYIDADGNIALETVAASALSIAIDGVVVGLVYKFSDKNFYAGFLNGAVSSTVTELCTAAGLVAAPLVGPYIGVIVGGILGSAAGAFIEDYTFHNDEKSVSEMAQSAAQAAATGILSSIGFAYVKYAIKIADEAGSVAQQLMKYDKELGKALEKFFSELISALGAAEGN